MVVGQVCPWYCRYPSGTVHSCYNIVDYITWAVLYIPSLFCNFQFVLLNPFTFSTRFPQPHSPLSNISLKLSPSYSGKNDPGWQVVVFLIPLSECAIKAQRGLSSQVKANHAPSGKVRILTLVCPRLHSLVAYPLLIFANIQICHSRETKKYSLSTYFMNYISRIYCIIHWF